MLRGAVEAAAAAAGAKRHTGKLGWAWLEDLPLRRSSHPSCYLGLRCTLQRCSASKWPYKACSLKRRIHYLTISGHR